jgi:hypothetical protein
MKTSKYLIIMLVCFFALSSLTCTVQSSVTCPKCHGVGKIPSQPCAVCGGTGVLMPSVTRSGLMAGGSTSQTNVTQTFHNNEAVEITGIATATVNTQTDTYTNSTETITIPPNGAQTVTISFNGLTFQNYYQCLMSFTANQITCPTCAGTGGTGPLITCPKCGGTGLVSESGVAIGGGFDFASLGVPAAGVALVAVGVVGSVVVVKKRRLTEGKIKGFTSSEFNSWVLQRFSGHGASILDSRKGIDGLTGDGVPMVIKQSDNVGKIHVDNLVNAVMQLRARRGVIVGFGFDKEAIAAVNRAKVNYHLEIKAVTVKELLERKEAAVM